MAKLSLAKLERHLYSAADRLRQEGLDAATYKDYIFGLLFLKRCSDVFEAEREKLIEEKIAKGMSRGKVEEKYGEDPNYYDTFFVPERARWAYLESKLGDAREPYGKVLEKALGAMSEFERSPRACPGSHQLHARAGGKACRLGRILARILVRHFARYPLRNEDFQFSDRQPEIVSCSSRLITV